MRIISIKFVAWDTPYYFLSKDEHNNDLDLKVGDKVLVETIIGIDVGEVFEIKDVEDDNSIKPIIHIATEEELEIVRKNNLNVKKILKDTKNLAKKYELDMKLSDIHISYDDKMMIISFISDGRVDFRELVKMLSKKYKRKIRLYQLGVRDEAKFCGDIGDCGQVLCCKRFLKKLESINTGFARDQQVAHRGLDKLSGMCGRLKCCLAYEEELYQDLIKDMPEIGEKIKTKHGSAEVIELLPLRKSIRVKLDSDGSIITVELTKEKNV